MDSLLYGHNPEECIVAAQQLNDQTIRLFKRIEGKILQKDVEFFPFFFLSDDLLIKDFPNKFWLKELAGNNYYRFIAAFTRWSEMWEAVHYILRQYNKNQPHHVSTFQELKEILIRPDPVRQFLLQSGITLFKGMEFNDLVRLHIDVQFMVDTGKKRSVKSTKERLLVISLVEANGKITVLSTHKKGEQEIIKECIQCINEIDPDVISGFDLFKTILPAINRTCEQQEMNFSIGRDGSDMRAPSGFGPLGFGESDWLSFDVLGRHLVDIRSVAEAEMDVKKGEQSFNLHSLAKHFGIASRAESSPNSNKILEEWKRNPKQIADYSLSNATTVRDLANVLMPSLFYLAQVCPFNFRMLVHTGPPARIESLMLREYIHQKHSIPKPTDGSRAIAMPSEIFNIGVFAVVIYLEIDGLYSSIIEKNNIKPKSDNLDIFFQLLIHLNSLQKETPNKENLNHSENNNIVSRFKSIKLLLDSFHLYIGSPRGLFNDLNQSETILTTSREILKEVMHQMELFNVLIIQSDGQGFFIQLPDNIIGEVNQKSFIQRLTETLPVGVNITLKKSYSKMLSYRKSNYALLDHNNNLFIKGNSLISRGIERYLRVFIQRFIECLMTNDFKRLHHAYASAYTQVVQHQWTPIDFCRTDLSKMDIETYQKERLEDNFPRSPAMEAAINSSSFVKMNSKIFYYITGTEASPDITKHSRLIEEWNPNMPDENTAYYLARLQETANKMREFFEPAAFERILSLDEIFGFSDEGITILSRKVTTEPVEAKPSSDEYSIWLAEAE